MLLLPLQPTSLFSVLRNPRITKNGITGLIMEGNFKTTGVMVMRCLKLTKVVLSLLTRLQRVQLIIRLFYQFQLARSSHLPNLLSLEKLRRLNH